MSSLLYAHTFQRQCRSDAMRILLIEDNDDDACVIRETLAEPTAMALEGVDRLEHGLTRLASGPIDIVLLDLSLIDDTIASLRRLVSDLRPAVLDRLGLVAALEWQASEFERRTGISTFVAPHMALTQASDVETALFRVVQAALTNVVRHARAARVTIRLREDETSLQLTVHDGGRGISDIEAAGFTSFGLLGLKERVSLLGGTVSVRGQSGHGTSVTASIPLKSREYAT